MTDTDTAPSAELRAIDCPSIFAALDAYVAERLVPAEKAEPGDFLGLVLELSLNSCESAPYNNALPVRNFIVMTEEGLAVLRFWQLTETQKNIAARLSAEVNVYDWNGEADLSFATDALENEESGLHGQIYLLPNLGLLTDFGWECCSEDLDPADPGEWLEENFHALRRPADSNHDKLARQALESPDLAVLNALIRIASDPDDNESPPLRLTLPHA